MPLAALLALSVLAATPADATVQDDREDVPASAPKDDYRFVAWCYGALDEYLQIYDRVKPDLKEIDKLFGSPVVEAEPYSDDIAEDRKALKRFGQAIEAAEKASLRPIAQQGAAAMDSGRRIWAAAELQPSRKLADAWLYWGLPVRCDHVAKTLKTRATLLGQAFAVDPPKVDSPAAPAPEAAPPAVASPASSTAQPAQAGGR